MSTFLYTRPSDRVTGPITIHLGAENPNRLGNWFLFDSRAEAFAQFETATGSWAVDLGSPVPVEIMGFIYHNWTPGQEVYIQNSTDGWATLMGSWLLTLHPVPIDYLFSNCWLDLKTIATPALRTARWWRIVVWTPNTWSQPTRLGEWCIYRTRRDLGIRNISRNSVRTRHKPAFVHETKSLIRRTYCIGPQYRSLSADVEATETTIRDIDEWYRDAYGVVKPFLIVPHKDEPDCWFAAFSNPEQPHTRAYVRRQYPTTLTLQEHSRGLYT